MFCWNLNKKQQKLAKKTIVYKETIYTKKV